MEDNNKKRKQPLPKELIGQILDKKQKKVYSHQPNCSAKANPLETCQSDCNYGTLYYELNIQCENKPLVKTITVFQNLLEKEPIWKEIEEVKYYGKKYIFYCRQWMNWYKLLDWKELK